MSQILELKKQITFEELCPKWAAKIASGNCEKTSEMNLTNAAKCIVGEAHGWSRNYRNCDKCLAHSHLFCKAEYDDIKKLKRYVVDKDIIPRFVDHWNSCHIQRNENY